MAKLTCHCGGVEAEVKISEKGFKRLWGAIALFVKERAI